MEANASSGNCWERGGNVWGRLLVSCVDRAPGDLRTAPTPFDPSTLPSISQCPNNALAMFSSNPPQKHCDAAVTVITTS